MVPCARTGRWFAHFGEWTRSIHRSVGRSWCRNHRDSATIEAVGFADPALIGRTGTNQLIVDDDEAVEFLFSLQLLHHQL